MTLVSVTLSPSRGARLAAVGDAALDREAPELEAAGDGGAGAADPAPKLRGFTVCRLRK